MVKYWLKIVTSPENCLLHTIYTKLVESHTEDNNQNWASVVKSLLERNGFGLVWAQQGTTDTVDVFVNKFRCRLIDQYYQLWNEEVSLTSNNRLYKSIKGNFGFEEYLDQVENSNQRKAITKLRLSSHNFMIERGRWGVPKVDIKDRLCTECNLLEDEYHCIMECKRFVTERKSLPKYCINKPSMQALVSLFKSGNVQDLNRLGLACLRIMIKYESYK